MINYFDILKKLQENKFESKIRTLNWDDRALTIEDITSELYINLLNTDNEKKFIRKTDEYIYAFLKNMYSKNRKYGHCNIISDLDSEEDEDLTNETNIMEDMLDDDKLIELCKELNLTNKEILCLLYLHNKKSIKMYDYDFIRKSNEKSVDKNKLNMYYGEIINKLLNKFRNEIIA